MSQCPQCGAQTTDGQPYCGACGATLAPAAQNPADSAEPPTQIAGHRRQQEQPDATAQFPATPPAGDQQWQQAPAPQDPNRTASSTARAGQGGQQYGQPQYGQPDQGGQQQWQQPSRASRTTPSRVSGSRAPSRARAATRSRATRSRVTASRRTASRVRDSSSTPSPTVSSSSTASSTPRTAATASRTTASRSTASRSSSGPDLKQFLVGNWAGAAIAAGGAFGTALLVSLVVAFAGAEKLSAGSAIWSALIQTTNAFGANTIIDLSKAFGTDDATFDLGQYPLLATFLALGVGAYLFRRGSARTTAVVPALLDVVRAALILSVLVTIVAIIVKIADPTIKGYIDLSGEDPTSDAYQLLLLDGPSTVSIAGAIFLPFLLFGVVLAATCFVRRDWLNEKLVVVHEWAAAPLAGLAALCVGLFGAGLVFFLCQIIGEEDARGVAEVVRALAALPAIGMFMLGLGASPRSARPAPAPRTTTRTTSAACGTSPTTTVPPSGSPRSSRSRWPCSASGWSCGVRRTSATRCATWPSTSAAS